MVIIKLPRRFHHVNHSSFSASDMSILSFFTAQQPQWGNGVPGMGGSGDGQPERKRKRKSRWAQEEAVDKTIIPGMPTVLPGNLSKEQERQYICKFE